eukprot:TRINITY_DN74326_c0_g1_i1.p1 TRINITY_DN74326_c0_g1~~TRINITY_DN74326_c0_g1_i1.p1  ORF type:complete len:778 (+),score=174.63 TRINITY_DN74326_c0_g1_i1:153-2486(+)
MQPSHDSWDFEPVPADGGAGGGPQQWPPTPPPAQNSGAHVPPPGPLGGASQMNPPPPSVGPANLGLPNVGPPNAAPQNFGSSPELGLVDISKGKGGGAKGKTKPPSGTTVPAPGLGDGGSDAVGSAKGAFAGKPGSKGGFKGDKGDASGDLSKGKGAFPNKGGTKSWGVGNDQSVKGGADQGFTAKSLGYNAKGKVDAGGLVGKGASGKPPTPPVPFPCVAGGKTPAFGGKGDAAGVQAPRARLPFTPAPRLDGGKGGDGKGVFPKGGVATIVSQTSPASQLSALSSALAAVAASRGGSPRGHVRARPPPTGVRPESAPPWGQMSRLGVPRLDLRGSTPVAPGGRTSVVPLNTGGKGAAPGNFVSLMQRPALPALPPSTPLAGAPQTTLAPELLALMEAAEGFGMHKPGGPAPPVIEKKPRILLLITRLAPELQEGHMQQILDQCGEVQAWRRGRGATGEPLSFGFAQFGDPEVAWKVSTCLSKKVLCGQEVKVLVEETAETIIQKWRSTQKSALKVSTDEELEWELERKSVSCKALIDAKIEDLYGIPDDKGVAGAAGAQRQQALVEREQARVERAAKRKSWRESEYTKELYRIESDEKRIRAEERETDNLERSREEEEARDKADHEVRLAKMEELGTRSNVLENAAAADAKAIYELVDRVQAEPRQELFQMELDVSFLREEKIFEKKLRPWLERKVDFLMGGPQSDLVEYILRRVNAAAYPDALISDLTRYLDDHADALVERMWRMLVLELTRGGHGIAGKLRSEKQNATTEAVK